MRRAAIAPAYGLKLVVVAARGRAAVTAKRSAGGLATHGCRNAEKRFELEPRREGRCVTHRSPRRRAEGTPQAPSGRGILANALGELGRNDEAIEVLTESIRREPDYFSGHLRLASLYRLGDRVDAARAELTAALRINPRFTMAMAEAFYVSSNKEATERFKLGLRKAGLPD